MLPRAHPVAWDSVDNSLFSVTVSVAAVRPLKKKKKRTGQALSQRAESFYTFKPCDAIPLHHSNCSAILNTDTQTHTYISAHICTHTHTQSAGYCLSYITRLEGLADSQIQSRRDHWTVCVQSACVFLGTGHVDEGVLSWRLRGEAVAGGRLAHAPQCDQQERKKHLLWT